MGHPNLVVSMMLTLVAQSMRNLLSVFTASLSMPESLACLTASVAACGHAGALSGACIVFGGGGFKKHRTENTFSKTQSWEFLKSFLFIRERTRSTQRRLKS